MSQFHEHPDGWIYIRTPAGTYCDTRANYLLDHQWQLPAMPDGAVNRIYDDEHGIHQMHDAKSNHRWNGPVPWDFGDRAIANVKAIMTAQTARVAAEQVAAKAAAEAAAKATVASAAEFTLDSTSPTNVKSF